MTATRAEQREATRRELLIQGRLRFAEEGCHDVVLAEVAQAAERHEDPWEQLRAGCRAFLAVGSDPAVRRILLLDTPTVLGRDEGRAMDEEASARHLSEALEALNEAALWPARSRDPEASAHTERALDRLQNGLRLPFPGIAVRRPRPVPCRLATRGPAFWASGTAVYPIGSRKPYLPASSVDCGRVVQAATK